MFQINKHLKAICSVTLAVTLAVTPPHPLNITYAESLYNDGIYQIREQTDDHLTFMAKYTHFTRTHYHSGEALGPTTVTCQGSNDPDDFTFISSSSAVDSRCGHTSQSITLKCNKCGYTLSFSTHVYSVDGCYVPEEAKDNHPHSYQGYKCSICDFVSPDYDKITSGHSGTANCFYSFCSDYGVAGDGVGQSYTCYALNCDIKAGASCTVEVNWKELTTYSFSSDSGEEVTIQATNPIGKIDYVYPGNMVVLKFDKQLERIVTVDGTVHTIPATQTSYSFEMPSRAVSVVVKPVKQPQTVSVTTPVSKTYNQSSFNLNAAVA